MKPRPADAQPSSQLPMACVLRCVWGNERASQRWKRNAWRRGVALRTLHAAWTVACTTAHLTCTATDVFTFHRGMPVRFEANLVQRELL
eukprot:4112270-Pleurochrysis_carterae.AAC.1